jgi:hypothetical protein
LYKKRHHSYKEANGPKGSGAHATVVLPGVLRLRMTILTSPEPVTKEQQTRRHREPERPKY